MGASLIRRLTLCKMRACPFAPASDEHACWGQCTICGKVSGYVTRKAIRLYMDAEDRARPQSDDVRELEAYQTPEGYGDTVGRCLTFAEIDALLAAERERCAAVAASFDWGPWWQADQIQYAIAAQIRSLPNPPASQGETP